MILVSTNEAYLSLQHWRNMVMHAFLHYWKMANLFLAPLQPILHEIWAIYSFTQEFLSNVSLKQKKFFVEQMEFYGILKTL